MGKKGNSMKTQIYHKILGAIYIILIIFTVFQAPFTNKTSRVLAPAWTIPTYEQYHQIKKKTIEIPYQLDYKFLFLEIFISTLIVGSVLLILPSRKHEN